MKLYNAKTGKPEALPEDQINDAVRTGSHGFKRGTKVNVLDEGGKSFSIDASELPGALNDGFNLEMPRQTAVREYVADNKGLKGDAKVALTQFADEALMGIPELIYEKTGDPLEVAKREALKKEHEAANVVGGVAGFGASALYGGPVSGMLKASEKAAAKLITERLVTEGVKKGSQSIAKKLAKDIAINAAKLGVEGAVYSAPTAITEASLGDPELAAETLLMNGAAGAGIGVVGGLIGKSLSKLTEAATAKKAIDAEAPGLWENFKNERAAKAIGFSKGQIKKLRGGSDEAKKIGAEILEAKLRDGENLINRFDTTEKIAEKISRYKSEVGEDIGSVYSQIDNSGEKHFNAVTAVDRITTELGDFYKSPLNKDITSLYDNAIETVLGAGEMQTLSKGKEILDQFDNIAYPGGKAPLSPTPKQQMAKEMRDIIREEINKSAEVGAEAIGNKELSTLLKESNKKYGTIKKAEAAIKDKLSSEQGNKFFGLTDTIAGVGVAAVDPISAVATIGIKKLAEKYGNQFIATLDRGGLLLSEQAMKKTAIALDSIPTKIDNMLKGSRVSPAISSVGAINRFLGAEDYKKTKIAAFNDLSQKLAQFNENPAYSDGEVSKYSAGLEQTGAPTVANNFSLGQAKVMKYLQQYIPKPLSMSTPFKQTKWEPSDFELSQFERRLEAIQNPLSIIDDMEAGTLTMEGVDAVKNIYPKLFANIQQRITDHFMNNPTDVAFDKRIKLSLLLQTPIDESLQPNAIKGLQQNFMQAQAGPQGPKPLNLPSMETETQALSNK